MRTGRLPFPDERLAVLEPQTLPAPVIHDAPRLEARTPSAAPSWWPSTAASTPR